MVARADRSPAAALQAELHVAGADHRAAGRAGVLPLAKKERSSNESVCDEIRWTVIMAESRRAASISLKRTLGRCNLVALGIGAIIGAGLFSLTGIAAAHNAGPGRGALVRRRGDRLRVRRAVLQRIRHHDPDGGQRLHLRLRDAGRIAGLDHRLGPGAGVRRGRGDGVDQLVGVRGLAAARLSGSTCPRN